MSTGPSEPQVLYSVNNIRAYHIQDGVESELTTSGPQTMSLLMVPTSSPFAELPAAESSTNTAPAEEDFYLHLHLPPELDQPLPATTQIYHQPPSSYLIPRWDVGPDSAAFTRIEFPGIGRSAGKVTQEEVDTFETILAQCTAFLERAAPPLSKHESYNPANYGPGEGYVQSPLDSKNGGASSSSSHDVIGSHLGTGHGQIVLIDEENGSVVGELQEGYTVVEDSKVQPGLKTPVEIQLPTEGQGSSDQITVSNLSEEHLSLSQHPSYAKSTIVQTSARASRLIVTTSNLLANAMTTGADTFQRKTQPNLKPLTFSPAAQARVRQIHNLTAGAAQLSSKTVGHLGRYAQNFGARIAGKGEKSEKLSSEFDAQGKAVNNYRPGVLNKSMIAFSTIADGIDHAGRTLLASGSAAATNMVGHKYGQDARAVASNLTSGVKNVGLVYIDAVGVSRRAVIKSVAKGMVIGRLPNGKQLVVGSGDGGVVAEDSETAHRSSAQAPPSYESASSTLPLQGQSVGEKQ